MSARVVDLLPGDKVSLLGMQPATFVARTEHPIWPHLQLVIWRMPPGHPIGGDWSHDALDARQEVGDVEPADPEQRQANLRAALLPGQQS